MSTDFSRLPGDREKLLPFMLFHLIFVCPTRATVEINPKDHTRLERANRISNRKMKTSD